MSEEKENDKEKSKDSSDINPEGKSDDGDSQLFDGVLASKKSIFGPFGEEDTYEDDAIDTSLDWWPSKPRKAEAQAFDDYQEEIRRKLLENNISFDFDDSTNIPTFEEILELLSKRVSVPFEYHPDVKKILNQQLTGMNLRFDNINVISALSTLLTMKGLTFEIVRNLVYIKPRETVFRVRTENYRVQNLLSIPEIEKYNSDRKKSETAVALGSALPEPPEIRAPFDKTSLISSLQRDVAPHTWLTIPRVSAALAGGKLIVSHLPPIHEEIATYLEMLEDLTKLELCWKLDFFAIDEDKIEEFDMHWNFLPRRKNLLSNAMRFALVVPEKFEDTKERLWLTPMSAQAQSLNYQTAQIRLLKQIHLDEKIAKNIEVPAGIIVNITPHLYPHHNLIDTYLDLHFAIVRKVHKLKLGDGTQAFLPQQLTHKLSGRLAMPLNHVLLLRDVFNPFPDEGTSTCLLAITPSIPVDNRETAEK